MRRVVLIGAVVSALAFVAGFSSWGAPAPGPVEHSGCCSHHHGVCGCSKGHAECCDGSQSPSCGCD